MAKVGSKDEQLAWQRLSWGQEELDLSSEGQVLGRLQQSLGSELNFPESWYLPARVHRLIRRQCLPPGHRYRELLGAWGSELGQQKAARAFERMRSAQSQVPVLSVWSPETRLLLWASPAPKPHSVQFEAWPQAIELRAAELADGVCELWASAYWEQVLWQCVGKVKRLDLALVVTAIDHEIPQVLAQVLPAPRRLQARPAPLPGLARVSEPLAAFERELVLKQAEQFAQILEEQAVALPAKWLLREPTELGIHPDFRPYELKGLTQAARLALVDLVSERGLTVVEPELGASYGWLNLSRHAMTELREFDGLREQLVSEQQSLQQRRQFFAELDLRILPDDGLKRTLEELLEQSRLAARLAAKTSWAAALALRLTALLLRIPVERIDGGLELPGLVWLREFEACMVQVRADTRSRQLLLSSWHKTSPQVRTSGSALALLDFAQQYPELWGPAGGFLQLGSELPERLLRAARLALERPFSVDARLRETQSETLRRLHRAQDSLPRVLSSLLAPLSERARQLVLLREEARWLEVQVNHMLGRVLYDVDRRLLRIDPGLSSGAALDCTALELLEAVDMSGMGLRARSRWRKETRLHRPSELLRGSTKQEPQAGEVASFVGLTGLRHLSRALLLPYLDGPLPYPGRHHDSLACLARSLGLEVQL